MTAGSLVEGIQTAFLVDAVLATCELVVSILVIGEKVDRDGCTFCDTTTAPCAVKAGCKLKIARGEFKNRGSSGSTMK